MSRYAFAPGAVEHYRRHIPLRTRVAALLGYLAMLCLAGAAMVGAGLALGYSVGVLGG